MAKTRSSVKVWLLGMGTDELSSSHLPTKGEVLQLMMKLHSGENVPLKEAAQLAMSKVLAIWQRARIPHQRIDSGVRILMKLYDEYAKLKKNRHRCNEHDLRNQEAFKERLVSLFDVATSDTLVTIKIEEDRQFLIIQRLDVLSCSMAGVDNTLSKKEARKTAREEQFKKFTAKVEAENPSSSAQHTTMSLSGTSGLSKDQNKAETESDSDKNSSPASVLSDSDSAFEICSTTSSSCSRPKRSRVNILAHPLVAGALDRVNMPDRGATFVIGAVAKALGHDVNEMTLSRSSVRRLRCKNREQVAATTNDEFFDSSVTETPLVLHWDGKLLVDITGSKEMVDRIAVLVTGNGVERLLGVPKIGRGTGQEQAEACLKVLDDWCLLQRVRGLVFDTTASNTGLKNGACTFIESTVGQEIAWIACRHHMMELVLRSVFTQLFGASGGPNVGMFKRFQQQWPYIDKDSYDVASDDMFDTDTAVLRREILNFCTASLDSSHPREDYKELLELCRIFLGGYPDVNEAKPSFRAPGAFHHARWMAKAIYSLKIYLFQKQFSLTTKEKRGIQELVLFVSLIYIRFWYEAPLAVKAPLNDLLLLSEIQKYPNKAVAKAASTTFTRHLWHLSEIMAGLAFF